MKVSHQCAHCRSETKSVKRDISSQVWSVLLFWQEVDATVVDQPLCNPCYRDIREVLIDRADELERLMTQPALTKPTIIDIPQVHDHKLAKAIA